MTQRGVLGGEGACDRENGHGDRGNEELVSAPCGGRRRGCSPRGGGARSSGTSKGHDDDENKDKDAIAQVAESRSGQHGQGKQAPEEAAEPATGRGGISDRLIAEGEEHEPQKAVGVSDGDHASSSARGWA
ncbi:hypothetical protein D3C72_1115460 [compost metagenome]